MFPFHCYTAMFHNVVVHEQIYFASLSIEVFIPTIYFVLENIQNEKMHKSMREQSYEFNSGSVCIL